MPFTTISNLGRRVLLDDWRGLHRDRILISLYQLRDLHGEEESAGLTRQQVQDLTGLSSPQDTNDLLQEMTDGRPRLLRIDCGPPIRYRISPRGVRWVEESPRGPAS
jgi:hypothetical protein